MYHHRQFYHDQEKKNHVVLHIQQLTLWMKKIRFFLHVNKSMSMNEHEKKKLFFIKKNISASDLFLCPRKA